MKRDIENRVSALEMARGDWVERLEFVDYLGVSDYGTDEWEELLHDDGITVYRNNETGEVRGVYEERRTDEQIIEQGGDLAFL